MSVITAVEPPAGVLLRRHAQTGHADCSVADIDGAAALRRFVQAFCA